MSLFTAIRVLASSSEPCAGCLHFTIAPDLIERELRGLSILSSAHASVCADDGLCRHHDRMINGRQRCGAFCTGRSD
jgi:hypothetical protein